MDIIKIIKDLVEEQWSSKHEPLLLSQLPKIINHEHPDLDIKKSIGDQGLKSFIEKNNNCLFSFVQHPTQKAKLGIIPYGERYSFERFSPDDIISFRKILDSLDKEQLKKMQLPAELVLKLLQDTKI